MPMGKEFRRRHRKMLSEMQDAVSWQDSDYEAARKDDLSREWFVSLSQNLTRSRTTTHSALLRA